MNTDFSSNCQIWDISEFQLKFFEIIYKTYENFQVSIDKNAKNAVFIGKTLNIFALYGKIFRNSRHLHLITYNISNDIGMFICPMELVTVS